MNDSLIVPINIEALCINSVNRDQSYSMPAGTHFQDLPTKQNSSNPYLSESILHHPFEGEQALELGIHIHWSLPDALTRGIEQSGNIHFRPIPDRWLVARTAYDESDNKIPTKFWLIESNYLSFSDKTESYNHGSLAIPYKQNSTDELPTTPYIGKIYKLSEGDIWKEGIDPNAIYKDSLTAVGFGIADYAAYYPNCRNVLGFYDDVKDLSESHPSYLSYVVIGWHSKNAQDPLCGIKLDEALRNFSFSVSEAPNNLISIDRTLYHGLIHSIVWDTQRDYFKDDVIHPLKVVVANNGREAMARMLANNMKNATPQDQQIELILNALQLGMLDKLALTDGAGSVLNAIHKNQFSSLRAGTTWIIKSANQPASQQKATDIKEIPSNFIIELNKLNHYQECYDKLQNNLKSLSSQLFCDWYKYLQLSHSSELSKNDSNTIKLFIDRSLHFIDNYTINISPELLPANSHTTNTSGTFTTKELADLINSQSKILSDLCNPTFELAQQPGPRYWHPNDPVLLLTGEDILPALRYGGDNQWEDTNTLRCRLSSHLISQAIIPAQFVDKSDKMCISITNSMSLSFLDATPNKIAITQLLNEVYLLDPYQLLALAKNQGGTNNPALLAPELFLENVQNSLSKRDSSGMKWDNILPSPLAIQCWKTPWLPISLQWQATYYPITNIGADDDPIAKFFENDVISKNVKLNVSITDFCYIQSLSTADEKKSRKYEGNIFMNPHIKYKLCDQLKKYMDDNPQSIFSTPLQTISNQLQSMNVLSQSLSGFNNSCLMKNQVLQLDIADPNARSPLMKPFVSEVKDKIGNNNTLAPEPMNAYSPIQAGKFAISKLRIIDVFGRYKEYNNDNHMLKVDYMADPLLDGNSTNDENGFVLKPRLIQPARLAFNWISANSEQHLMGQQIVTEAVFGWILPNYIDNSLVIYNSDGTCIGMFAAAGKNGRPLWQGFIGNDFYEKDFQSSADKVLTKLNNKHLSEFMSRIYNNGADFVSQFIKTVDDASQTIHPKNYAQYTSASNLVGTPLALARASLKMELCGLPANNVSWNALDADIEKFKAGMSNYPFDKRINNNFTQVDIPVYLGNKPYIDDGLIGYFKEVNGESSSYFYSEAAPLLDSNATSGVKSNFILKPEANTLTLKTDPDAAPFILTLILDPRAKVQATIGMVPTKSLSLTADHYKNVLSNLHIDFLIAPILTTADTIYMPTIPTSSNEKYNWMEFDGDNASIYEINEINTISPFQLNNIILKEGWVTNFKKDKT